MRRSRRLAGTAAGEDRASGRGLGEAFAERRSQGRGTGLEDAAHRGEGSPADDRTELAVGHIVAGRSHAAAIMSCISDLFRTRGLCDALYHLVWRIASSDIMIRVVELHSLLEDSGPVAAGRRILAEAGSPDLAGCMADRSHHRTG
jgi:hypothetical protein